MGNIQIRQILTLKGLGISDALIRKCVLLGIILLSTNFIFGQTFVLIDASTKREVIRKDSTSAVKFLDSLANNRFYFTRVVDVIKHGEKTIITYNKGKDYNKAVVEIAESTATELSLNSSLHTNNLDSLKQAINQQYIDRGFPFSRVKTTFLKMANDLPHVSLTVITAGKRRINSVKIKGYEKAPKRFVKNLEKSYAGKTYTSGTLKAMNVELQNHPYIQLEKPPQTLFTKDSTQVYLFLQKKKTNTFDGVIGFGNDDSKKIKFNGTLDLNFRNIFNGFESISIFWQRSPNRSQTFDLKADVPYLAQSNVGFRLNTNIYKQDSTFANVKVLPSIYYNVSPRQKMGLRGTLETSSVMDSLYTGAKDFTRRGVGLWYEYVSPAVINLFQYQTNLAAQTDLLFSHYSKENSSYQIIRYYLRAEHNIHLKGPHYLNLKAESALLKTKEQLGNNELFRLGGWNSLRGFNENSLLGDFYIYGGPEYRYLINDQAFADIFAQYGQVNSKYLGQSTQLYSVGFGFNIFLPVGLMSFQISNGSQPGVPFNFRETKVHWGILTHF